MCLSFILSAVHSFSGLQKNSVGKKHGLRTVQLGKTRWPRKWRNFLIKLAYRGFTRITVSGHLPSLSWISVEFRRRTFVQCPDTGVLTAFCLTPPIQRSILHDQSHSEVRKRSIVSGELLPALHEGTANYSDVVPSGRQTDQQVVSSQSGCQAVTESC